VVGSGRIGVALSMKRTVGDASHTATRPKFGLS
jgi:hypothetical protein